MVMCGVDLEDPHNQVMVGHRTRGYLQQGGVNIPLCIRSLSILGEESSLLLSFLVDSKLSYSMRVFKHTHIDRGNHRDRVGTSHCQKTNNQGFALNLQALLTALHCNQ